MRLVQLVSVSGFKFSALYGLDDEGRVLHWQFATGTWMELPLTRVPWVKPAPKKRGRKSKEEST